MIENRKYVFHFGGCPGFGRRVSSTVPSLKISETKELFVKNCYLDLAIEDDFSEVNSSRKDVNPSHFVEGIWWEYGGQIIKKVLPEHIEEVEFTNIDVYHCPFEKPSALDDDPICITQGKCRYRFKIPWMWDDLSYPHQDPNNSNDFNFKVQFTGYDRPLPYKHIDIASTYMILDLDCF